MDEYDCWVEPQYTTEIKLPTAEQSPILLVAKDGTEARCMLYWSPNAFEESALGPEEGGWAVPDVDGCALRIYTANELAELMDDDELTFVSCAGLFRGGGVYVAATQDLESGVNAFVGTWPGEETTEELVTALDAIDDPCR